MKNRFNLIEAVVVIMIIGIMISLLIPMLRGMCTKASNLEAVAITTETVSADVEKQASGLTVEQENIKRRLELENAPGSIKHLYAVSTMSGQCIVYSTVKGKVSSSNKRLNPASIDSSCFGYTTVDGKRTLERRGDDGTYGPSGNYIYWWDTNDKYHQLYVGGGLTVYVGSQPMPMKNITMNLELIGGEE